MTRAAWSSHMIREFYGMRAMLRKYHELVLVLAMVTGLVAGVLSPVAAYANSPVFVSAAKVSFTFDDGMASSILAAQTLQPFGYSATQYVATGCVQGVESTPGCSLNPAYTYLTWDQVAQLQNIYGWEIGAHSVTHASLRTVDTPLDSIKYELYEGRAELARHGINAEAFAFPYGHYDDASLAEAAKLYSSIRRFEDSDNNLYPYNDNLIMIRGVQAGVTVATVKSYIDQAIANNYWLVLVFHEISPTASPDPEDYEYTPSELSQIAEYVKLKNVPVSNMTDGIATSATNLLPNGGFANGLTEGWTTDDPAGIVADSANHGSYPEPANSIAITAAGGVGNTHLLSPLIAAGNSNTAYVVKSYVNVITINSGQLGYYIDEYDAAGAWISGQDKATVASVTADDDFKVRALNFLYTPTSAAVAYFRIEVVVGMGTGIQAYIDSFQLFPESAIGGSPTNKEGDVNGDSAVDALDLSIVLSDWNIGGQTRAQGDLTGDGFVDALDLSTVLSKWGS